MKAGEGECNQLKESRVDKHGARLRTGRVLSVLGLQLSEAASWMDTALFLLTGLDEIGRKLVVYWTLATHSLPYVNSFPLLVLKGPPGTGKSKTLLVIEAFAYRPNTFSLRAMTQPAIRDELVASRDGTALIEEGDYAWKDDELFERMLSDRYHRKTARAALKVPAGPKGHGFKTATVFFPGATAIHRRLPSGDPALDSRSVFVRFRPDTSRDYLEFREGDAWIVKGRELMNELTFEPVEVAQPPEVAPRIFDTYRPLLSVAQICGDDVFPEQIRDLLLVATAELKAGQSIEQDGLVVRALVECLSLPDGRLRFRNVRFSELADSIFKNQRVTLRPQKIGAIARQLGLETKESHGFTVVASTPATLLRACAEVGYEDEAVAKLRKDVLEGG